jgi:S-adenosylmethionine decarboxylase proenzyme
MWGCSKNTINNTEAVKEALVNVTRAINATLVDVMCHHFSPYGVTGIAILAESHISVHTWPEHEYAAVDIFICDNDINLQDAVFCITQAFNAKETSKLELKRGDLFRKSTAVNYIK